VILPTLGNNDYTYHYQSPFGSDEQEYYSFFFDQYFAKHPTNKNLTELASIKNTLLNGGYYRVDLSDNTSFLGLNTLMYNKKN
jgi:hypothetical protein